MTNKCHAISLKNILTLPNPTARQFEIKTPRILIWIFILLIGGFSLFIPYQLYKQGSIQQLALIGIELIIITTFLYIVRISLRKTVLTLDDDKIFLKKDSSLEVILFAEIHYVHEEYQDKGYNIKVERKDSSPIYFSRNQMSEMDYYDLLEFLEGKFPRPEESHDELKKKKKKARIFLVVLTLVCLFIFLAITILGDMTLKDSLERFAAVILISLLGGGLSWIIKRISTHHRNNRHFFQTSNIKNRRLAYHIIVTISFFAFPGLSLYFLGRMNNAYVDFTILPVTISLSLILYLSLDKALRVKTYTSYWERGFYFCIIFILGSSFLTLSIGTLIKSSFTQVVNSKEGKATLSNIKRDGSKCYTVKLDLIPSPEICSSKLPFIQENDPIAYNENFNDSGFVIYSDFRLKENHYPVHVRRGLLFNMDSIQKCFSPVTKKLYGKSKTVKLVFRISKFGLGKDGKVTDLDHENLEIQECISTLLKEIYFGDPPHGQEVFVNQPLNIINAKKPL